MRTTIMALVALGASTGLLGQVASPAFQSASIRVSPFQYASASMPWGASGGISYRNVTLEDLIKRAYGVFLVEIENSDKAVRYDIDAEAASPASEGQLMLMLRTLLADRFKLTVHQAWRELPISQLIPDVLIKVKVLIVDHFERPTMERIDPPPTPQSYRTQA